MIDEETPRRRNRRSRRLPVADGDMTVVETEAKAEAEPEGEEIVRGYVKEVQVRNERASAELLKLLQFHHRHGYGEYNNTTKDKT